MWVLLPYLWPIFYNLTDYFQPTIKISTVHIIKNHFKTSQIGKKQVTIYSQMTWPSRFYYKSAKLGKPAHLQHSELVFSYGSKGPQKTIPFTIAPPPKKKTKLGDKMNLGSDKVHTENQKTLQDEDSNRRDCSTLNTTYLTQSPWKSQQFFLEAGK